MTRKERKTLEEMYQALERLPGNIRRDAPSNSQTAIMEAQILAAGAERARVLVYAWLREANMIPPGGR